MRFSKNTHPLSRRRPAVVLGVVILLVLLTLLILEVTNRTHLFHKAKAPSNPTNTTTETKGEPEQPSTPQTTPTPGQTPTPGDNKSASGGGTTTSTSLLEPSGNFVSNHSPSLSGSNHMQSTCNTTPGATCQISFMKGGVTKTLPAKTTDRGGAAYWSWDLQDIGLTEGEWQIQATATLNGQTKTSTDALPLKVGP